MQHFSQARGVGMHFNFSMAHANEVRPRAHDIRIRGKQPSNIVYSMSRESYKIKIVI